MATPTAAIESLPHSGPSQPSASQPHAVLSVNDVSLDRLSLNDAPNPAYSPHARNHNVSISSEQQQQQHSGSASALDEQHRYSGSSQGDRAVPVDARNVSPAMPNVPLQPQPNNGNAHGPPPEPPQHAQPAHTYYYGPSPQWNGYYHNAPEYSDHQQQRPCYYPPPPTTSVYRPPPVPDPSVYRPPPQNYHYYYASGPPQLQAPMMAPADDPWRHSFQAGLAADSEAYMPESSLLAATTAGPRRKPSAYPAATLENIGKFRAEAKASKDPAKLLDLAKYMMEALPTIVQQQDDPKRAEKIEEAFTAEAQKLVRKLASQRYAEGQYFLAQCYSVGAMGLKEDQGKAFGLYVQGAKQNHAGCSYRVGVCYEHGLGTKRDKGHAIQFYRKAANLGEAVAMYKLGMVLLKGQLGQSKNEREGISWLKRAAQLDHVQALHELGVAYEKKESGIPSVIPDVDYARDLFTQAAQDGYAPSQFKLGLAYENGLLNCPVDARRSIAWYAKAAEQGHLESELALSGWYLTGAEGILQQSDAEAYLWARKAADKGYAKAEYAVGYYTETGIGVRQNLEEAKMWYMRAAAQDNQRAIQRLAELKRAGAATTRPQKKHIRNANGKPDSSDCAIM